MSRLVPYLAIIGMGALATVVACSSDGDPPALEPTSDGGGQVPEASPPTLPDAGADADADADAKAPPRTCSADGFCHIPLPAPQSLRAVWGDGTGVVWAVGKEGGIFRWDGATWAVHSTVKGALTSIWGSGPTDIWIGGVSGILHGRGPSSDNITFEAISYDSPIPITSIHGFGPNDVWAVGGRYEGDIEEGHVLHYTGPGDDAGTVFRVDPISSRPTAFSTVWGSGPDDVWVAGSSILNMPQGAVILHGHASGGGTVFEDVPVTTGQGSMNILNVGGGVRVPDDFIVGRNWWGQGVVWSASAFGDGGTEAGTVWDGEVFSWGLNTIWGTSKTDVWVAGEIGRIRHWDGTTWAVPQVTIDKFPVRNALYGIWGKGPDDFWIVGDDIVLRKVASNGGAK